MIVVLTMIVSVRTQVMSMPADLTDDNVGTDLEGMKQLFVDTLSK
jgi:hypothetical protein